MADAVATTEPAEAAPIVEGALVVQSAPAPQATPAVDAAAQAAAAKAGVAIEEKAPAEAEGPPVVEYQETGDPGLDLALSFVGNLGIDHTTPAMQAALKGDFTLIEAVLAGLGDKAKGYDKFIALAKKSYSEAQAADQATATAIQTAVFEVAGSAEQWKAIQEWAKKEADPKEKEAINRMLSADPIQARAAAQLLVNEFQKRGFRNPASATSKSGASSSGDASQQGNLTRREALAETQKLVNRIGVTHNIHLRPEYQQIWNRVR